MAYLQGTMSNKSLPIITTSSNERQSSPLSQRSRRQLGLYFAGAGFFAISSMVTRRSLIRRYKATVPKFYQPNNRPSSEINGAMEAFEALNIATINVLSVGMMLSGGLSYAFDISSMDDMRRAVRSKIGVDVAPTDQDVEEEIEEWFATVLERKGKKDKNEIARSDARKRGTEK